MGEQPLFRERFSVTPCNDMLFPHLNVLVLLARYCKGMTDVDLPSHT
jgi:hypothetical protein